MIRRIEISDEFVYRQYSRKVVFRDVDTGEKFDIFPSDMPDLFAGKVFEVNARESNRGGYKCLKVAK